MTAGFNERVSNMKPSATLAMSAKASELRRAGKPVIALSAGEPDFDTPVPISEAGVEAIQSGFTNYTPNPGMPDLREAISEKFARENDLDYDPEQILCSNGAKQSVALAIHVLCGPGDEVLIPAPHWVSYPEMTRFAGAEPVIASTTAESGYRLSPLCSPSNPTGAVYPPDELEALAGVLRDYPHVQVLSDEIYEHVRFPGSEHVSFASLDGMKERTVTVNGFSKAFAMTGWRLGYLAAEPAVRDEAAKVQSQFTSAPSSISQKAGVAALQLMKDDPAPVHEMVDAFEERRDFVLGRLGELDVQCPTPGGAFYLFPDVSAYLGGETPGGRSIEKSEDLCFYLLEEHHVALVPGGAFGAPSGLRLSYAASMEDLRTAMDRVSEGLGRLAKEVA
ncbi:MAG: aspartate aminotransferase [Bacteroidetes bacterium SW_4_67_19]|nr:MAG: aspartate aminotransferase [Bacteroidetes bacterium SW_4_67_19]